MRLKILIAIIIFSGIVVRAEQPDSLAAAADSLATQSLIDIGDIGGGVGADFAPALSLDALVAAPSPEAAAMTRHLEEGMDYASGTASLSVPLFSWSVGEIPMNLSLSYRIGAKELTTTFSLNEYDFAARRLSPLGSFTQPDPLAGKYPSISPYSYCAADPINLIDPSGMEFTDDAEMWAKRMEKYSNGKITENNRKSYLMTQQVLSGKLKIAEIQQITATQRQLHEENKEPSAAQAEIKELKESSQVYDVIVSDKYGTTGITSFNEQNGNVEINLPSDVSGQELAAHEFKHASQFERGEYSLSKYRDGFPLYDYTDEVQAYRRSDIFSGYKGEGEIPAGYSHLQKNPMDIRSWLSPEVYNDVQQLQAYANSYKCVFRFNKRTYVGKRFNSK